MLLFQNCLTKLAKIDRHNRIFYLCRFKIIENALSFSHLLFELQNVIEEYKSCVVQHDPVLDADVEEIEISAAVWFRQYDVFELFDLAFSAW